MATRERRLLNSMARERRRRISRSRCCARTTAELSVAVRLPLRRWPMAQQRVRRGVERPWSAGACSATDQTGSILRQHCRAAVQNATENLRDFKIRNAPGTKHARISGRAPYSLFTARYSPARFAVPHAARPWADRGERRGQRLTAPALRQGGQQAMVRRKPGRPGKAAALLVTNTRPAFLRYATDECPSA